MRPDEHSDGVSLLPVIQGESIPDRPLIWHYPHYGNQGGEPSSIIRQGDWKLIHYYQDGREELYNLANDLEEKENIANQHPDQVKELSGQLFAYLKEVGARFPERDSLYDAEKEQAYLERIRTQRWPNLEAQRKKFLAEDFDPENDWWGSAKKIEDD